MKVSAEIAIRNAEQTLRTARTGLLDLCGSCWSRRLPGLRNLLVFGQAAIDTLGRGEVSDPRFRPWFERQRQAIESESLMQHIARIRGEVLARTELEWYSSVSPKFKPTEIARLGGVPAGAKGFFLGDNNLGSGWIIGLAEGCDERYFVELPEALSIDELVDGLPAPEDAALQLPLEELCALYFARVERLLANARREFIAK